MNHSQKLLEHFEGLVSRFDVQRRKQRYYFSELRRWLRYVVPEESRVLELGCGDGTELMALKPSQAMGIDFSHGLIQLARARHPEGQWLVHDISDTLPPMAQTFEYILAIDLVGYLQDFQGAMEQVRRICAPETRL
ncbi:MAG: class I SAM-dependent methyltransferase, partial [Candidatus Uhrbacteria bacterium]|nr:class I SAM-dependent methyltransferase [Candidatus Uhrbacteria bacterium]